MPLILPLRWRHPKICIFFWSRFHLLFNFSSFLKSIHSILFCFNHGRRWPTTTAATKWQRQQRPKIKSFTKSAFLFNKLLLYPFNFQEKLLDQLSLLKPKQIPKPAGLNFDHFWPFKAPSRRFLNPRIVHPKLSNPSRKGIHSVRRELQPRMVSSSSIRFRSMLTSASRVNRLPNIMPVSNPWEVRGLPNNSR